MTPSTSALHLLTVYSHLTPRDLAILALLDEHRIATTGQIHRLHFDAARTCQIRLRTLHHLGLLDRFRYPLPSGGVDHWHWVLGLHGARYMAGTLGRPFPTERAHRDQVLRLSAYPALAHLRATTEFGIRLACTARTDTTVTLDRWWSERTATARFLRIRPDAHGLWTSNGHTTGWFLECDMGTEALTRVVAKLDAYEQLAAAGGPTYPILFWLASKNREANLHQALRHHQPSAPVATATHDRDPAGPVWLPVGGWQRVPLHTLPSDHGRNNADNPNWVNGHLDLTGQHETAPAATGPDTT